jgi:hypothetical protein
MIRYIAVCATVLLLANAAVAAPAQTPPTGNADKQAISKACSDQANAKGLHGKARKSFRAKCKRRGGKPV